MIEFRDDEYIKEVMTSIDYGDFEITLPHLTCYTYDNYENNFICVIIGEEFIGVSYTYAVGFSSKRKLLRLMKELHKHFKRRILVGKDSQMFNRYKVSLNDEVDEIILKESSWVEAVV